MIFAICSVIGTGASNDSIRVPFPTYTMVVGPIAGKCVVALREEDVKDSTGAPIVPGGIQKLSALMIAWAVPVAIRNTIALQVGDPDVINAINAADLAKWKSGLDARYREHAGEYNGLSVG